MDSYFVLLAAPFFVAPFIFKKFWPHHIDWVELALNIVVGVGIVAIVYFAGRYNAADDVEIWNGEITGKSREHGHYLQPYSCNCRTVSCGKDCSTTQCDTCYEDRYTVDWDFQSTIGKFDVKHLDRSSRSVYNEPDPPLYKQTQKGDSCSREVDYVNWVKAVPESLYNTATASSAYADKIPTYPRVYNLIHINRVLTVDVNLPNNIHKTLNSGLNERLENLGPALEMNIVLIVTSIQDPMYKYAVENAWVGAKKNDAVVFIGVDDALNITWTDAMTFAQNRGNELFHVRMRDALKEIGSLQKADRVVDVIANVSLADFTRVSMKEFEHLKHEIDPPTWIVVLALVLGSLFSAGFAFFAYNYKWNGSGWDQVYHRSPRRRYR